MSLHMRRTVIIDMIDPNLPVNLLFHTLDGFNRIFASQEEL